jgi:hypothetical protein
LEGSLCLKQVKLKDSIDKIPWAKTIKTVGEVLKEYVISNTIAPEKIFVSEEVKYSAGV